MKKTIQLTALLLAIIMLICITPVYANEPEESIIPAASGEEGTSYTIAVNDSYSGSQRSGQDYTFYFSIPSTGLVTVQYSAALDVYQGQFYDNLGGATRSTSWDNPTGKVIFTSSQYFSKGDYSYVFHNTGNGTFIVTVAFESCNETFPETYGGQNNTLDSADPIVIGNNYFGVTTFDDPWDVYAFTVETNGNYVFTFDDFQSNSYPQLYVYDQTGTAIAENTGSFSVELSAGVYYLAVRGNDRYSVMFQKEVVPTLILSETIYTYDGTPKTPAVTVMDGNTIIPASDYTVLYFYNVNGGIGLVSVFLTGPYTGRGGGEFVIMGWQKIGKAWYYYDNTGTEALGWKKIDGNWYYFKRLSGALVLGWIKSDGKYYYSNPATGILQTGWVTDGGKYYYFSKTSGVLQSGLIKEGVKYYYFSKKDGSLQTGFVQEGVKYYYFSKTDGSLQTGFVQDGGKYYYFSKTDGSLQMGFVKESGKYYYFSKTDGSLQTGFVKDGSKYYYFNPASGVLRTGWLNYNGDYYYLNPADGALVIGTSMEIDGVLHTFNAYGVCIK